MGFSYFEFAYLSLLLNLSIFQASFLQILFQSHYLSPPFLDPDDTNTGHFVIVW